MIEKFHSPSFCGLNRSLLRFRFPSPSAFLALFSRYSILPFSGVVYPLDWRPSENRPVCLGFSLVSVLVKISANLGLFWTSIYTAPAGRWGSGVVHIQQHKAILMCPDWTLKVVWLLFWPLHTRLFPPVRWEVKHPISSDTATFPELKTCPQWFCLTEVNFVITTFVVKSCPGGLLEHEETFGFLPLDTW